MVSAPGLNKTLILTGTTASGKTALSLDFARARGLEIINADSLLVFRKMNIGTAKPSAAELAEVPHHLIDLREPDELFTAGDFVRLTEEALAEIHARGKRAMIVGGTGFYLKALLFGLWDAPAADMQIRGTLDRESNTDLWNRLRAIDDPFALKVGPNDRYRLIRALEIHQLTAKTPSQLEAHRPSEPDPRFELWVVDRTDAELAERIHARTGKMLEAGFLEEARQLIDHYPTARTLSAVGYAQLSIYLKGEKTAGRKVRAGLPGLQDEIELATRQLVKKQRTWFKSQKYARFFMLERDRAVLEHEFKTLYGP